MPHSHNYRYNNYFFDLIFLGYLDNYVMYDSDLRPMEDFEKIINNFKSTS